MSRVPAGTGPASKSKFLVFCVALVCVSFSVVQAAVITKKNSTAALSTKSSWIGNNRPTSADIALWNSTVTGANTVSLGNNLSWLGIQITNPGGLVTFNAGYTLTLGTSGINMSAATQNLTLNCALMLGSTQVWDVTTGRTLAAAGVIGGTGGLTKNGLGTVSLSGTNTFTGATTINGGIVAISSGGGLGASTAVTTINAGTLQLVTGKTVATTRQFKVGNAASTFQVDAGSSFTLSGTVSNSATAGNLIKTGTGTLILSASAGNTYGGAGQTTSINGGTLQVGNDNQLGNIATSVTFNGGTLTFSSGFTSARSVVLNAASGTINTNNNSATLSGILSGAGSLTKAGAGTLTLTGTNTYSGGTSVTGGNSSILSLSNAANAGSGLVTLGDGSVLLSTASFTFSNGLVLGAAGGSAQPDGNLVSGIVNVQSGTTLTLSGTGISESTSGTGRLEKFGSGTLVVNTANSYSGGTYLHEGTFVFGNALALGPQPSNNPTFNQLTIDNGAQLKLSTGGAFRRNVLIGTGGGVFGATTSSNVAYRNGVFSNVTAQSGGVTLDSGVNGFGGNNTFSGNVTINSGAVAGISRDVNLGALANQILLNGGGVLRIEDGVDITGSGGTISNAVLATFSSNRQITLGSGTGTIEVKNFADTNPSFDVSDSNPIVPAGGRPTSHTNTFTLNGSITGAGGLIKAGNGILVLANAANNYTGGTTINGGILSISNPAALGSGSNLTINPGGIFQATGSFTSARTVILGGTGGANSGGTFDVTGTNNETRTGVISGSGSLTKTGSGTLTLAAANTFTGDLYLNEGTITVVDALGLGPQPAPGSALYATHMANGTTIQTGANSTNGYRQLEFVSGSATLVSGTGSTQQRNGLLYGAGGLIKAGTGTLILTNANTYSGGTTINAGKLHVNNASGSGTGSGGVAVNSGGLLSGLPAVTGFALPGAISGSVTVNNGGAVEARSGSTFTFGGLTLNAGAITNFGIGPSTSTAIINISGVNGLSLAGLSTINVSNSGGLAAGTYCLFDYTGAALPSIVNLQLGSTAGGGFNYSLSNNQTNTTIDLIVSASSQQWANDSDGNWNVSTNWTDGVTPNSTGAQANFFNLIHQPRAVTVNGAFTIGTLTFDDLDSYTIAGSGVGGHGLTLNNGGASAINVHSGNHTIAAPLTLANDLQLASASGSVLTISGAIGESGASRSVTSSGAGSVILGGSAANAYTGLTTVSAGTLNLNKTAGVNAIGAGGLDVRLGGALTLLASNQIADTASVIVNGAFGLGVFSETVAALTGSGTLTTAAGGTLTVGASNNLNSGFTGVISGAGTLAKSGSGTLTLTGANTFGGSGQTVTINAGILGVGSDGNLGNAANSITFNGGSLLFTTGFATGRGFVLSGNGIINTENVAVTLSGGISGAGSLTKAGPGTLTLSGTSTYSGGTFITGGNSSALSVSSASNLGSGAITLSGGSALISTADLSLSHNFTLGSLGGGNQGDGQPVSGIFNVAGSTTLIQTSSSVISGGRLMKIGTGVLDLRGNNTYNGGTYLHEGTLVINSGTSFGERPSAGGDPFFNALTIDNGATLRAGDTLVAVPGRGLLIGTGGAMIETASAVTYFRNGPMANVIGQSGGLSKIGLGIQGLGGTNTFTGNVQVTSGVLSISRDANLGAASNQLFLSGGTSLRIEDGLDNYGATPSVPVLATFNTNRQMNLLAGNVTLEVKNYADTNPSFGAIAAPASHLNTFTIDGLLTGAGALVKSGDGALVLNNGANNYAGGTIINNGLLSIADASALGAATSGMAINNNAVFQTTGTFDTARLVTLGGTGGPAGVGGGIFEVSSGINQTRRGVISGGGSLSKSGSGTLNLLADNTYTGGSFINAGIVAIDRNTSLGSIGSSATIGNATLQVLNDVVTTRNHALSHANSSVQIDEGATYAVGGIFSGNGALNKTGAGTLALTGVNTYTGGTFINGGTIAVNNAGNLGTSGNSLTVNAGILRVNTGFTTTRNISLGSSASTIEIDPAQTYTVNGVLSGSGALNKTGTGALSLGGANTFTGETIVDEGTLTLAAASGSALASTSAVTVNNGGTLLLGASNQIRDAAPITLGGGTFAKGNFSEGAANSMGLGALTLTDTGSRLDFGAGTVGILTFASFSAGIDPDFESLIIDNWTGTANTIGNASTDRLIFNASQSANLAYFNFTGYADGATQFQIGSTGFYEVTPVTPVPEPATYLAGVLALAAVAYQRLRRRTRVANR